MKKFIKKPGSPVHKGDDCILVSDEAPDTIKIPEEVARMIGVPVGHTPCLDAYVARCICGETHDVVHYVTKYVSVAECPYKGFLWYRKKP